MTRHIFFYSILIALFLCSCEKSLIKDGTYKSFHDNGTPKAEWTYRQGKWDGPAKTFFPSGIIKTEGLFKMGKRDGLQKTYFENGKIQCKNCRDVVDMENLLAVLPDGNQISVICDKADCQKAMGALDSFE